MDPIDKFDSLPMDQRMAIQREQVDRIRQAIRERFIEKDGKDFAVFLDRLSDHINSHCLLAESDAVCFSPENQSFCLDAFYQKLGHGGRELLFISSFVGLMENVFGMYDAQQVEELFSDETYEKDHRKAPPSE